MTSEGRQQEEAWSRASDCFCSKSVREDRIVQVQTGRSVSFGLQLPINVIIVSSDDYIQDSLFSL